MSQMEDSQAFSDVLMLSMANGATTKQAAEHAVRMFSDYLGLGPYAPRLAYSKPEKVFVPLHRRTPFIGPLVPRLPEKEWWPLVAAVVRRDGGQCQYCSTSEGTLCADHVIPLSRGGTNAMSNLVACCLPCNSSKSDRLISEWTGRYPA